MSLKQDPYFKYLALALVIAVVLAFAVPGHAAERKDRSRSLQRSGTYTTGGGQSGTLAGSVTRGAGQVERRGSATNQDGATATAQSRRAVDPETGTVTYTRTTTASDGRTAAVNITATRNADGTVASEGTRTGFSGRTSTAAGVSTRTEDGRATTGTVTGADGRTAAVATTVTRGAGERNQATTVTGELGRTGERVVAAKVNGDGTVTRTIQFTGPDGRTSARTETLRIAASGN